MSKKSTPMKWRMNALQYVIGRLFPSTGMSPPLVLVCSKIAETTGWDQPTVNRNNQWDFITRYATEICGFQLFVTRIPERKKKTAPKARQPSLQEFKAFYLDKPWRTLRYDALKLHGSRCQCCGGTPVSTGKPLHVDHIKPRSKFPELELVLSNLQILCEDCNMGKGGRDQTDWRPKTTS